MLKNHLRELPSTSQPLASGRFSTSAEAAGIWLLAGGPGDGVSKRAMVSSAKGE